MATIEPVDEGLEHRPGEPDDIVRIWSITERAVTEVFEWTPLLLAHIRQSRG
ncbi:hypothetical protein GCM10007147_45050 [Nocardiopsis kunsanensis]|uniref:Uncharacterized protein n=1 Tax=Nocardiopsis kunsanensis TaxID=141693 RepID=A0A919CLR4_9ACTN|nr:hypothetical protein [Nocardiopsis kunsanensis]GHD37188.1 hypothetical protein GCM10007147_45050 [Nocardiopsis kunsanensis]